MADHLDWHGEEAIDHCRQQATGLIHRAALAVTRRAKELLSVAGTAVRAKATRKHRKGSRITGAVRSKPGEPPRKQTGRGRASVTYEVDEKEMTARVGTNVKYMKALELGTKKGIAPRPWLRRALAECAAKIDQILGGSGANP